MIVELTNVVIPLATKLVKTYSEEIGFGEHFSFPTTALRLSKMELCYVWLDGDVKGIIGGSIGYSPWNSTVRILQEEIFYVHPEHQNGAIGGRLLSTYLKNLNKVDAEMFTMKTMTQSPESVEKLYKRHGFTQLETTYVRR